MIELLLHMDFSGRLGAAKRNIFLYFIRKQSLHSRDTNLPVSLNNEGIVT